MPPICVSCGSERGLTQEQAADKLGVSAQSVSRWETAVTLPDVMLLPEIAKLYSVLVDDLFKPAVRGYSNNAQRLLAVYERTGSPDDFIAATDEFDKLIREGRATADDWRSYGVIHEYMMNHCIKKATSSYQKAMALARCTDEECSTVHGGRISSCAAASDRVTTASGSRKLMSVSIRTALTPESTLLTHASSADSLNGRYGSVRRRWSPSPTRACFMFTPGRLSGPEAL